MRGADGAGGRGAAAGERRDRARSATGARLEALAAQLAATQERYQTLFETLPQGVIYYDTNGLILGANPAACTILGLDEDELITWPLVTAGPGGARGRVPAEARRLPGHGRAAHR